MRVDGTLWALVSNLSSDGGTIKLLVRGNLKAQPHFFNERMWNIEVYSNDVNGTGANSEGVASGRCPVEQQHRPVILLLLKDNWRHWHVLPWSCGKCYVSKRDCCWELAENSQKKNWRGSHHNNKQYPHPLPLQEKKENWRLEHSFLTTMQY